VLPFSSDGPTIIGSDEYVTMDVATRAVGKAESESPAHRRGAAQLVAHSQVLAVSTRLQTVSTY
jgi:hypothetical protein